MAIHLRHLVESLRRPLGITFLSSATVQAVGIVTGVVLARTLGPSDRGDLGTVVLWPSVVASLVILGIPDAVSVLTAGRTLHVGDAVRSAMPVVVILATVGILATIAIESIVLADANPSTRAAATLYLAFVPINMVTLTFVGALSGERRFGALNTVRLSVVIVAFVVLPALAMTGLLTVGSATLTYLIANALALALAVGAVLVQHESRVGRVTRAAVSRLTSFGARSHVGTIASVLGERLDQLLISALLLPVDFGLYLAAVTLSAGAGLIASTMTTVALPTIAAMAAERRLAAVRRYLRITATLTVVYAIGMALMATFVLTAFFGQEFEPASDVARILLAGAVPLTLSRTLAAASSAAGRPGRASTAQWLALACAIPAYALLVPAWGIVGAAWAFVAAGSASLAFQAGVARTSLGAHSVNDLVRKGAWESP